MTPSPPDSTTLVPSPVDPADLRCFQFSVPAILTLTVSVPADANPDSPTLDPSSPDYRSPALRAQDRLIDILNSLYLTTPSQTADWVHHLRARIAAEKPRMEGEVTGAGEGEGSEGVDTGDTNTHLTPVPPSALLTPREIEERESRRGTIRPEVREEMEALGKRQRKWVEGKRRERQGREERESSSPDEGEET